MFFYCKFIEPIHHVYVTVFSLAVFFLEFWKRRQFYLQYDWDMLGYESAEVLNVFLLLFIYVYCICYGLIPNC